MEDKRAYKSLSIIIISVLILGGLFAALMYWNRSGHRDDLNADKNAAGLADRNKAENQNAVNDVKAQMMKRLRPLDDTDHILGEKDAPVQMIVYSDFECPYSAKFSDTMKEVKQYFGSKVAISFRHYTLSTHANAIPAAEAAECAADEGKFWEMHDLLFADNKAGRMNMEAHQQNAGDLGLDKVKFSQCLTGEKYKDKIIAQMIEGRNVGVTGTPTIFVNNEIIPGAYPFEDFSRSDGTQAEGMKKIIEKKLK